MTQGLGGPGIPLPPPQNLYPTVLANAPIDSATNKYTLAAGDEVAIPAGEFYVGLGSYCTLEFLDPVMGVWVPTATAGWQSGLLYVKSDGFNVRVANRLCCPIGGVVIAPGSGYVQASTTISVTGGGGSTWAPIIGGQLTMFTATIVTANAGAGYGVAPIVIIPPPPPAANNANGVGGVQANGYATIASGTVSGFTFTNPGAGYPSGTFNVACLPNPTDPNIATGITLGTITFSIIGSGSICGILNTNPGAPISNPANLSLTVSGVGSAGSVNPILLQTITAASVVGGSTINAAAGAVAGVTTVGGQPPQGTFTNSENYLYLYGRPRPANIGLVVGGAGTLAAQVGSIYDGGFFYAAPSPLLAVEGLTAATGTVIGSSTISLTMGSRPDVVLLQPAP